MTINRREAMALVAAAGAALTLGGEGETQATTSPTARAASGNHAPAPPPAAAPTESNAESTRRGSMTITCFIRYQIDPFQRDAFKQYAENWARIIPRCGGHLVGYFLPYEGTNDIGWGLIAFDSLASYEAYKGRLRSDPEARENFAMAQSKRFILREERNFVEVVDSTFGIPAKLVPGK